MNQARRNYLHSVRVDGAPHYEERERFPCFHLCDTCGYLARDKHACGACGGGHLIDLGHSPTFHALEDAQGRDRSLRWGRARRAFGIGLALAGLVIGGLATAAAHSPGAWFAMGIVGVVAAGITMTAGRSPTVVTAKREGLAPKWRGPTKLPAHRAARTVVARGAPRAVAAMTSPLGAEPCVAYAVRVHDEHGRVLLEEHANLPMEIGGHALPEDAVLVDGVFEDVAPASRLESIRQWLRARGVRYLEGMRVSEVSVGPGRPAELARLGETWVLTGTPGPTVAAYR